MNRNFVFALIVAALAFSVAMAGCKGKKGEQAYQEPAAVGQSTVAPITEDMPQDISSTTIVETIPPTAQPEKIEKPKAAAPRSSAGREKDIQTALKNAGLYNGSIDGNIGPKTKKAIEEFQKQNGLKVDGKVVPRTWVELEKHL
mgnify:CR=1 FL=1